MKQAFVLAVLALVAGCTSSHVLVGKQRPPISPEAVQIYIDPPEVFEKVAILESNNTASWAVTQQQKTNKVVQRLKEEAAALGANGVLLQDVANQYSGSVGLGNAWASGSQALGLGVTSATFVRVGRGIAIFVPDTRQQSPGVAVTQAESAPTPATAPTLQQPPAAERQSRPLQWQPPKSL